MRYSHIIYLRKIEISSMEKIHSPTNDPSTQDIFNHRLIERTQIGSIRDIISYSSMNCTARKMYIYKKELTQL
jgi:hypothetical protein